MAKNLYIIAGCNGAGKTTEGIILNRKLLKEDIWRVSEICLISIYQRKR